MPSIPWIAVAVFVAVVFIGFAAIWARGPRGPKGEPEAGDAEAGSLTPLQRVAWWTLAASVACVAAVVALLLHHGVSVWWNDAHVRLPVTALMLGGLIVSGAPMVAAARGVAVGGVVDERDQEILARAPRVQGASMLVSLGLWTAVLMEAFHAEGHVPVPFVVLMCWTCFLVYALALPVGILLGYRRR